MDKDPCWKGYEMIGTKKKNGKKVPNCVPKEEYSFKSYLEGVERDKVDLEISKEVSRDKERHDRMRDAADRVDAASAKLQNRRLAQEGFASSVARFTLSTKDKARVMNVVSDLSDIPGNWDHKGMKFSAKGEAELKKALKNNKSEIAYAMSLDYSDFEESVSTVKESVSIPMYVQEAAYAGNIGMMELIKFYQKAKPDQVKELQNYIRKKMDKDAWQLVQKITGTKLVGKEFHKEGVNLDEGVKIIDRDYDLDQEHFILNVNGKKIHFVHHNYENSHAQDSKEEIHYQVKQQLKNLSPMQQKAITDIVHKSYRIKEEVAANSVAGGGVDMNPTGKPKWDKRSKFHIDHMFRRADGTKYSKKKTISEE